MKEERESNKILIWLEEAVEIAQDPDIPHECKTLQLERLYEHYFRE